MTFALIGVSLPNFWLGLMLIVLFSVHLGWLPDRRLRAAGTTSFVGWLRTATMPAVSLALLQIGPARAHHPLDHARGAAPGLHPHRARQGPAGVDRGRQARAQAT